MPRIALLLACLLVIGCGGKPKPAPAKIVEEAPVPLKIDLKARSVNAFATGVALGYLTVYLDLIGNANQDSDADAISSLYDDAIKSLDQTATLLEASLTILDSLTVEGRYTVRMYENAVKDIVVRTNQLKEMLVSGEIAPENIPFARETLTVEVVKALEKQYGSLDRSAPFCFALGLECGEELIYLKWKQFELRASDDAYWNEKGAFWMKADRELGMRTYEDIAARIGPPVRAIKDIFLRRRFSPPEVSELGKRIVEIVEYFYSEPAA